VSAALVSIPSAVVFKYVLELFCEFGQSPGETSLRVGSDSVAMKGLARNVALTFRRRNTVVDGHEEVRNGIRRVLHGYPGLRVWGEAAEGIEAGA
jgi:hypothetical protein